MRPYGTPRCPVPPFGRRRPGRRDIHVHPVTGPARTGGVRGAAGEPAVAESAIPRLEDFGPFGRYADGEWLVRGVACLSPDLRFRILAVFTSAWRPAARPFCVWGIVMADRAGAAGKAADDVIPAQPTAERETRASAARAEV